MKKVMMVLAGLVLIISGCAVKKAIIGESVCKPSVFDTYRITIDCDSADLKASLTRYFMSNNWTVLDGPFLKAAEYEYIDSASKSFANAGIVANVLTGTKASEVVVNDGYRKITTNGQLDLQSDFLLRVDVIGGKILLKITNYKTQGKEIVFDGAFPYDNYYLLYIDFCVKLHAYRGIKHIVFNEISTKRDMVAGGESIEGLSVYIDSKREEYSYDGQTNEFVLKTFGKIDKNVNKDNEQKQQQPPLQPQLQQPLQQKKEKDNSSNEFDK